MLPASAFEPGVGIAEKTREHVGIATAGGRDDFEHGARLVEVWAMDEPARATRRRSQMRQRLQHEAHPFRVAAREAARSQLRQQVQLFPARHPAYTKVREQAGQHEL